MGGKGFSICFGNLKWKDTIFDLGVSMINHSPHTYRDIMLFLIKLKIYIWILQPEKNVTRTANISSLICFIRSGVTPSHTIDTNNNHKVKKILNKLIHQNLLLKIQIFGKKGNMKIKIITSYYFVLAIIYDKSTKLWWGLYDKISIT